MDRKYLLLPCKLLIFALICLSVTIFSELPILKLTVLPFVLGTTNWFLSSLYHSTSKLAKIYIH